MGLPTPITRPQRADTLAPPAVQAPPEQAPSGTSERPWLHPGGEGLGGGSDEVLEGVSEVGLGPGGPEVLPGVLDPGLEDVEGVAEAFPVGGPDDGLVGGETPRLGLAPRLVGPLAVAAPAVVLGTSGTGIDGKRCPTPPTPATLLPGWFRHGDGI